MRSGAHFAALESLSLLRHAYPRGYSGAVVLSAHLDIITSREFVGGAQSSLLDGVANTTAYDPGGPVHVLAVEVSRTRQRSGILWRECLPARRFFRFPSAASRRGVLRGVAPFDSAVRVEVEAGGHGEMDR